MEKIILERLTYYLNSNDLISIEQYGFKRGHSTADQILYFGQRVRDSQNLRPSHHTVAVFLDLSKAFDRVWRNKLIIKLFNTFGIRDRALSWIFDFLKDREIRVRFRDSLSKTFRLSQGVPQGSVLSPLLFSLYIAGIEKIISRRCEVGLFADDIVLWNSNSDVVHIETAINTTLSDIQIFAEQHKLIFNVSKSTSSFFTTNRRLYNYQPQIFMESKSLLYEKHPKYLGYILDPEILSNKHIDYVINKGRRRLDLLKYIAGRDWGADAGTLRLTYTSLIRPVLEYGSQIYFSASRTNLAKLNRVQSSAARIITGMRHSCPTDLVLFEADIMPLDLRRKLLLSKSELIAIDEALRIIKTMTSPDEIWILCDSRSAIQHISDWTNVGDKTSVSILKNLKELSQQHEIYFQWIPSHIGLFGNDTADLLAKEGVTENLMSRRTLTFSEIFSKTKSLIQELWKTPPTHPWYNRQAPGGALSIKADRVVQTTISRLASGHIRGLSFNLGQKIYENCTKCNLVQATPDHLLFCAGLEREDIYSSPLLVYDFLRTLGLMDLV
ncbi:probable RNA-directed DNA polymerase from transposon BS [Trichonephila clavipes]|nr:probable RNA-directed DNA polymerase from transposon BS [Trichonephila clavipes]